MGKEGLSNKDFLLGTIIGGVVGAATALLLAPKSGKELRTDINDQATYVRLKTEQMTNSAWEKGQNLAVTAKDKTVQLSDSISIQSSQVVNKVKDMTKTGAEQEELSEPSLQVLEDEVENQSISSGAENVQEKLEEAKQAFDQAEEEHNVKS
jgi:gas vesicle protein